MRIEYKTITIPAEDVKAGSLLEFPLTPPETATSHLWGQHTTVRVLGIRVEAGPLEGATRGSNRVFLSHRVGDVWVDVWCAIPAESSSQLKYTAGSWEGDVNTRGSLEHAVGTASHPLYVIYGNTTDIDQADDVRIDLVLGFE